MAFNMNREENKSKSHSQDFIPSFIRKTYDILEEARFPQFIDWNPEGTALVIKKPSEFSQKVLPIYFKHNNFTSFVRQLNMYDFHKKRTQGLDHVYIHDLFIKGKRHLLQGIKRKTHENTTEKIPKAPEVPQVAKAGADDVSSLFKENQFFKHLYNEAMNRLAALERRAKELAVQNQTLMTQICRQNESERAFKPHIMRMESQPELTQDQLPMTLGKMTLNFAATYKAPQQANRLFTPNTDSYMKPSMNNMRTDLQREESSVSGVSTEVSRNSPVVQCDVDNEENFPKVSLVNQAPVLRITHELSISRQEMSAGQMIDSWNLDLGNDEVFYFADQKVERPVVNVHTTYQDNGLLGKRQFQQSVDMSCYVQEPSVKRHEGMDSNLYINNMLPALGGYEQHVGVDLMEF